MKTFTALNHQFLLNKPEKVKVAELVMKLFKTDTNRRKQRVSRYVLQRSKYVAATCEVPQGTALLSTIFRLLDQSENDL